MLSYRHGFHAGNFVDVHKHISLILLLNSLKKKKAGFCYIDTHAGCGNYDLQSEFARKHSEYETGISRIWPLTDMPLPVAVYLDAVRIVNSKFKCRDNGLRFYPGSPVIARQLLRPQDRMILMELHNTEAPLLQAMFNNDKQVSVHHRDGFEGLPALVPPGEKRGLVLIDPSYEIKSEFNILTHSIINAWQKWPTGIYAIWYPVQARQPIPQFHYELRQAGIRKVFLHEFSIYPDTDPNRLAGSGMVIINPPWQFDVQIREVLAWLVPLLDRGAQTGFRCEWLVPE
jgi:23S rRNA (adenine2030-N6)-methyltransferase